MSYSVDFDPHKIYDNIQKSTDVALYEVGEKIIEDTEQFVPMKTGVLRASAEITNKSHDDIEISYERIVPDGTDVTMPLYEGVYYKTGMPVKHWTTPGTGGFWLENSEEANEMFWIEYFKERTREIWQNRKGK